MGINPLADPAPLRSAVTRDGRPTRQNHCVEDLALPAFASVPSLAAETRSVVSVFRSNTKTSVVPLVSSGTRFEALL